MGKPNYTSSVAKVVNPSMEAVSTNQAVSITRRKRRRRNPYSKAKPKKPQSSRTPQVFAKSEAVQEPSDILSTDHVALYFPKAAEYVLEPVEFILKEHGPFNNHDTVVLKYSDEPYEADILGTSRSEARLNVLVNNHRQMLKLIDECDFVQPYIVDYFAAEKAEFEESEKEQIMDSEIVEEEHLFEKTCIYFDEDSGEWSDTIS